MTRGLDLAPSEVRMFVCRCGHQWPVVVKPVRGMFAVGHEPGANICSTCNHLGRPDASASERSRSRREGGSEA